MVLIFPAPTHIDSDQISPLRAADPVMSTDSVRRCGLAVGLPLVLVLDRYRPHATDVGLVGKRLRIESPKTWLGSAQPPPPPLASTAEPNRLLGRDQISRTDREKSAASAAERTAL